MQQPIVTTGVPLVTIAMPALNEADHIVAAIRSVLPDDEEIACELLVVDGGSTDDTWAIVSALAQQDPRIRLVHNERRIQSAGVNLAARLAHPSAIYLVRADCHSVYPAGWVKGLIDTLEKHRAASVVVPLRTMGLQPLQRAIAAAQNSRFGNGGSAHRMGGMSGYVAHGHHAAFDLREFLRLGGYDETFTHNEDAEFDRRLCAANGSIYLSGELAIGYFPRSTLRELARQYFRYGRGSAKTLTKHRAFPRRRQAVPPLILMVCVLALALSVIEPRLLIIVASYAAICAAIGLAQALRWREPALAMSGAAAMVMHLAWGAGFLTQRGYLNALLSAEPTVDAIRLSRSEPAEVKDLIALPRMTVTMREEA